MAPSYFRVGNIRVGNSDMFRRFFLFPMPFFGASACALEFF